MALPDEQQGRLISPYLNHEFSDEEEEAPWQPSLSMLEALTPFARPFEQQEAGFDAGLLREESVPAEGEEEGAAFSEEETEEGLRKKLKRLSFLPHFVEVKGTDEQLTPAVMDPGIYDGPEKFLIATELQKCLTAVMDTPKFRHIRVALVDLTKDIEHPEFAGFNHKDQVFIASVAKVAAMLAAFQLRHDLRVAMKNKGSKDLAGLFAAVRDEWAATQVIPKSNANAFTKGINLLGRVVVSTTTGSAVALNPSLPNSPQLEAMFAKSGSGAIDFTSTGQDKDQLTTVIKNFNDRSEELDELRKKAASKDPKVSGPASKQIPAARDELAKAKVDLEALGALERLRVAMGGMVPASNLAISTIVRDVGYPYIASTLMQSGLYDTNRNGGLWLGADYFSSAWMGPIAGGPAQSGTGLELAQSGTAGSLAAMMTLIAEGRLVSPGSSAGMRALLQKEPNPTHPGIVSWFKSGLRQLPDHGSIVRVLSKLGVAGGGIDDWACIDRKVDHGHKTLHYVAVGLRARKPEELEALILELDKCILANNGLPPSAGGHEEEHEAELRGSDEEMPYQDDRQFETAWMRPQPVEMPPGEISSASEDESRSFESDTGELEQQEFRPDRLPPDARKHFDKGASSWREAAAAAIKAGIDKADTIADLIFYMQHPQRVHAGVGSSLDRKDPEFFKLRAEWSLYRTIAIGLLGRGGSSRACSVFLQEIRSKKYEDFVAAPTTGRVTLMINGRSGGFAPGKGTTEPFDSMQVAVQSLGAHDLIYLAGWQFIPTELPLTQPGSAGIHTWADLFKSKATEGVKIRVIVSDLPPAAANFASDLKALDNVIASLPASVRDNWKYISSPHTFSLAATHHEKFMVVRKSQTTIAFCGGLDISRNRTPAGWSSTFVWHDTHSKLEGLIAHDLEREFVLRWNREKDKSTATPVSGWKPFEDLVAAPVSGADEHPARNTDKVQMVRTVSLGTTPDLIRRDDIWQAYFRLIGCATQFIYLENQYFHEPAMADAIVKQCEARPELIVIVVLSTTTDDPDNMLTKHMLAMRHEFFTRLIAGIPSNRVRVYTMKNRLVHSKLVLVDDRVMTVGSANANPRGFFLDTELNVVIDAPQTVGNFRHRLWAHDLGVDVSTVKGWKIADFIPKWDAVADANGAKGSVDDMAGEAVVHSDPRTAPGERSKFIPDVLTEVDES